MRWLLLPLLILNFAFAQLDTIRQSLKEGLYSSVQVLASEFLETQPDNAEAHLLYAYALYYLGNYADARVELDKAQSLNVPTTSEFNHLSGLLKASEGDIAASLEDLQRAFEETQDYQIAMDWGRVAWENNQVETALQAFEKAAQTPFGQTQMWPELNRGRILQLSLKDYDGAIAAYNRALDIFDQNNLAGLSVVGSVEAFFRLGQINEILGNTGEAIANYQAALGTDPNYEPALAALERLGQ